MRHALLTESRENESFAYPQAEKTHVPDDDFLDTRARAVSIARLAARTFLTFVCAGPASVN